MLSKQVKRVINVIEFYKTSSDEAAKLPVLLLSGPQGSGKTRVVESVCAALNLHLCQIDAVNLAGESASAIEKRMEIFLQNSINIGPCIILLKSVINKFFC